MTSILIEFWTERETLLSEIPIMTEGDWIGKLREHDLDLSNLFLSKIEDCKTLRDDARQILNEDSHIKIIIRGIRAAMAFSNKSIGVNLLSNLL